MPDKAGHLYRILTHLRQKEQDLYGLFSHNTPIQIGDFCFLRVGPGLAAFLQQIQGFLYPRRHQFNRFKAANNFPHQ